MPNDVLEAEARGLKIPNLRRLMEEGSYATGLKGIVPTLTFPTHTTMLTGTDAATHGILNNYAFDPYQQAPGEWRFYAHEIRGTSLWTAARSAGLITASIDWPVSVGAPVTYNIPEYWRFSTAHDTNMMRAMSQPEGFLTSLEDDLGPYTAGNDYTLEGDRRRVEFMTHVLKTYRPRFSTLYLGSLDIAQHHYGPQTPEAYAHLEEMDALVGEVWRATRDAGGEDAVFCLISDHGFRQIHTGIYLNAALREAGLIDVDEENAVMDWRAYAWQAHGMAAVYLKDAQDLNTAEQVEEVLNRLAQDASSGVAGVHDARLAPFNRGFEGARFVVTASEGFAFLSADPSGDVLQPATYAGTHGYAPADPAMNASFFVAGADVPQGLNLGERSMLDVAPTLAALLDLELPEAMGHNMLALE